jgi:hypothetical protein
MPIKPPRLDDREYADILAEARQLIPQYCPEWTNLSDADPGMTLVQLFSWMTELTLYRLNRVPDKTYVHFLNFIGEERREARPAVAPATFLLTREDIAAVEVPPHSVTSTRQTEEKAALDFLTTERLTVHGAKIARVMAVKGGKDPAVREVPFTQFDGHESVLAFDGGRGVQFFDIDTVQYGPDSYTPYQFLYIAHDDLRLMNAEPDGDRPTGHLRVRRTTDSLSIAPFFQWEYPTSEGWVAIDEDKDDGSNQLGMAEKILSTALPGIIPIPFRLGGSAEDLPPEVAESAWWVRGRLLYENWIASRMEEDLTVTWRDDRGGEERELNNWRVRPRGHVLEFFLQDLPPIKNGWTVRLALVNRDVPAGRAGYLPAYRWSYRRGEVWEEIPLDRVRVEGTLVQLTGPFNDMAGDGFNLRAERIEAVNIRGLTKELDLELEWVRPVEKVLFAGEDKNLAQALENGEAPWSPFQMSPTIPPTIRRKLFIGSDLFNNRRKEPVEMEIEFGFDLNGDLLPEPTDKYRLQLTYRAEDSWRVVWTEKKEYAGFVFADLEPKTKSKAKSKAKAKASEGGEKRRLTLTFDPNTNLKGLAPFELGGIETTWLRLELVKSSLLGVDEETKEQHPIALRIYSLSLGVEGSVGKKTYEQPLPNPRMAQLDYREQNQRLTRVITRATGRLNEAFPFFKFMEIEEDNQALYIQFDRPLPPGARHAVQFRCMGEAFVPSNSPVRMVWEILEDRDHGRTGWKAVELFKDAAGSAAGRTRTVFDLTRSGVLEFPLPDVPNAPEDGFWLRGRFDLPDGMTTAQIPSLPPVSHIMLNTVNTASMFTNRTERYSGMGIPHQTIQLLSKPLYVHPTEGELPVFRRPDKFTDICVFVENDDGTKEEWIRADSRWRIFDKVKDRWTTARKDDRVFVVDAVEGTLTFGNGIKGRMLPVGSNNILVDVYRVVPGARANVGPHEIEIVETTQGVDVTNLLPATGGRDAESIDQIVRRAPSILTSRDRAVTRTDFELIGKEASAEVARAACNGRMDGDGQVEIVILAHRREGERIPDPFLSSGLRDHVFRHLKERCLVNVQPVVRLAKFMEIDISLDLRLRPNANVLQVREQARKWIEAFLDPYTGGLDGDGWPFSGTLYAQDFARMVSFIPEVRHVGIVHLYDMSGAALGSTTPGWEEGEGKHELFLTEHDLFVVRRVRVRAEETGQ